MRQRLAESDPELIGRDARQRAAPLQTVRAIGRALHHLLDLLIAEFEHVGVLRGGVLERRPQPLEQRVATPLGDPLCGLLERVRHPVPSSITRLICPNKRLACGPYKIR